MQNCIYKNEIKNKKKTQKECDMQTTCTSTSVVNLCHEY